MHQTDSKASRANSGPVFISLPVGSSPPDAPHLRDAASRLQRARAAGAIEFRADARAADDPVSNLTAPA